MEMSMCMLHVLSTGAGTALSPHPGPLALRRRPRRPFLSPASWRGVVHGISIDLRRRHPLRCCLLAGERDSRDAAHVRHRRRRVQPASTELRERALRVPASRYMWAAAPQAL